MSTRRERVRLVVDEGFSLHLSRVMEAARTFRYRTALEQATWEPHDWSEWS